MPDPMTIQIALFVRSGFTGRGLAKSVTLSLENYAFEVVGYTSVYYNFDFSNAASAAVPKALGYKYVDVLEVSKSAKRETGIWMSYKKDRDINLPPGILHGTPADILTRIISGKDETYEVDL